MIGIVITMILPKKKINVFRTTSWYSVLSFELLINQKTKYIYPEFQVDSKEFFKARKLLNKTQKQLSELLGISIKAVHSYEQGWRKVPSHVERQVFFLLSRTRVNEKNLKPCWTVKKCPPQRRKHCPAWEFQAGKLCWFINGTICECKTQANWQEKMKICRACEVLSDLL